MPSQEPKKPAIGKAKNLRIPQRIILNIGLLGLKNKPALPNSFSFFPAILVLFIEVNLKLWPLAPMGRSRALSGSFLTQDNLVLIDSPRMKS